MKVELIRVLFLLAFGAAVFHGVTRWFWLRRLRRLGVLPEEPLNEAMYARYLTGANPHIETEADRVAVRRAVMCRRASMVVFILSILSALALAGLARFAGAL